MRNNVTVSLGHVQNNVEAGAAREEVVQGCLLTHRVTSVARGINIHFVEAGPKTGPLVVFLHGFPEFWYTWCDQIGPLASAGFHVVVPDLRGFNESSRPVGASQYSREHVTADIAALIEACTSGGRAKALIGHGWGANVAWVFAMDYPSKVERLVVLNGPHPSNFKTALSLFNRPQSAIRYWYWYIFQIPILPEIFVARNDLARFRQTYTEEPLSPLAEDKILRHLAVFREAGALTGGMNYHRAYFRNLWYDKVDIRIDHQVLILWAERDKYARPEMAEPPRDLVPHAKMVRFPKLTYWLMWDDPEAINDNIIRFLDVGNGGEEF